MSLKTISLIGAGSFGTAIAQLLAHNGHTVNLWCHEQSVADAIKLDGQNKKYLPGIQLHKNIIPTTDLSLALNGVQWVFEAIPVVYLRSVLEQARPYAHKEHTWVVLSKGIENNTLLFPTQMIDDAFGYEVKKAIVAGPSFAREVAEGAITGVSIGATDCALGIELQEMLTNEAFHAYPTDDVMGVQVGAAFKNVISLGMGMLDGAGYGDNPKAFLFIRGLAEAAQCAVALGGRQETLYGLSGVGDLVLTSMGKASRNREVGRLIGAGSSLSEILKETGYTVEGVNTIKSVLALAAKYNVRVPVCENIFAVLHGQKTIQEMMRGIIG